MLKKILRFVLISVGVLALGFALLLFLSFRDYQLAKESGFESTSEMYAAREAGFSTKDAYLEQQRLEVKVKEGGFTNIAEMKDAEQRGFVSAAEETEAENAGFKTRAEYDAHLAELQAKERGFSSVEEMEEADKRRAAEEASKPALLLKCQNKDGVYFIAHAKITSTADFLYVKSGEAFSRDKFYNRFGTTLRTSELEFSYPDFKFNVEGTEGVYYRKWKTIVQRDSGKLLIGYELSIPLSGGSIDEYIVESYDCVPSEDYRRFQLLKDDYYKDQSNQVKEEEDEKKRAYEEKLEKKKF